MLANPLAREATELITALSPVMTDRTDQRAIAKLCSTLRVIMQETDPARDDLLPIFDVAQRGEPVPEIEVIALLAEGACLLEYFESGESDDK